MPFAEASFWVFLTMFGTGLYFVVERWDNVAALCLLIVGTGGMGLIVYQHHYPNTRLVSHDLLVWTGLGATWLFFAYAIYLSKTANRRSSPGGIEFFQHRIELERTRSIITEELQQQGETFWVIWQAGHLMPHISPEVRKKIHRMILCNPIGGAESLERLALVADAGTGDNVKSRIVEATRLAVAAGTPVKYSNEQSISLVIANPNNTNKSGWVRIEYILPFMPPTRRPSIVINEKHYPDVFKIFVDAYDAMWADATPAR